MTQKMEISEISEKKHLLTNYEELYNAVPTRQGLDSLSLSRKQRRWIQTRMWNLYNTSLLEQRDIEWNEIYKSLEQLKNLHNIFVSNIGPKRNKTKHDIPVTKEDMLHIKQILLYGDIDTVVNYFNSKKIATK